MSTPQSTAVEGRAAAVGAHEGESNVQEQEQEYELAPSGCAQIFNADGGAWVNSDGKNSYRRCTRTGELVYYGGTVGTARISSGEKAPCKQLATEPASRQREEAEEQPAAKRSRDAGMETTTSTGDRTGVSTTDVVAAPEATEQPGAADLPQQQQQQQQPVLAPDLHKTQLCTYFLDGYCKRTSAECDFAHGEDERVRAPGKVTCSSCGVFLCPLEAVCHVNGHVHVALSACTLEARANTDGVRKVHCRRNRCGKELGPVVGNDWVTLKHKAVQVYPDGAQFYTSLQDWIKKGDLRQRCSDSCKGYLEAQYRHQAEKKAREKEKKAQKKAKQTE